MPYIVYVHSLPHWSFSMKRVIASVAALLFAGHAAAETDTFDVTATVISACSISAGNLAFGNYDPLSAVAKTGTSTVTVTCSLSAPYNIALDAGLNGATVSARKMLITGGGLQTLNYALTRDLAGLLNWGTTVGTDTLAGVGTGLAVGHTVYGTIAAGQNQPIGSYTDTITATVTY